VRTIRIEVFGEIAEQEGGAGNGNCLFHHQAAQPRAQIRLDGYHLRAALCHHVRMPSLQGAKLQDLNPREAAKLFLEPEDTPVFEKTYFSGGKTRYGRTPFALEYPCGILWRWEPINKTLGSGLGMGGSGRR
jgi:hypothetical protein